MASIFYFVCVRIQNYQKQSDQIQSD